MLRIDSPNNDKVKILRNINNKKVRNSENLFLVEGKKVLNEVISINIKIHQIFVSDDFYENNIAFVEELDITQHIVLLNSKLFNSVSVTKTPQGIVALVYKMQWDYETVILKSKNIVLLDGLNDPGNFGTILRSGEALGCDCILSINSTVDVYNPKTVRSTMGSILRIPYFSITYDELLKLKEKEYEIFGLFMNGTNIRECKSNNNKIIVVGNESNGISNDVKSICNKIVSIKMSGKTESLNASMALGLAMYELF